LHRNLFLPEKGPEEENADSFVRWRSPAQSSLRHTSEIAARVNTQLGSTRGRYGLLPKLF
jgi:hypothetical protein